MDTSRDTHVLLASMRGPIRAGAWSELELTFARVCEVLAGRSQTARVAALDFASYGQELSAALHGVLARPTLSSARALYFEYELDNAWRGHFYLCDAYSPEADADDAWACDWIDDANGPSFRAASQLYLENHFDDTELAKGSTLYLVARTVAAFGRACTRLELPRIALCIAFHEQEPIVRIRDLPVHN